MCAGLGGPLQCWAVTQLGRWETTSSGGTGDSAGWKHGENCRAPEGADSLSKRNLLELDRGARSPVVIDDQLEAAATNGYAIAMQLAYYPANDRFRNV